MARAYTAILAATVVALNFSNTSLAGPFEDGMNAYNRADYSSALRIWRSLADQGNPAAQSNLGLMYAKGQGVPKDYVQAYMWSALSAAAGLEEGVKNRNSIAKGMTQGQISEAQKRASAWRPTGQPAAAASAPAPAQAAPVRAQAPTASAAQPVRTQATTTSAAPSAPVRTQSPSAYSTTTTTIIRR